MKVPYFDLSRSHQKFVVQAQEAFDRILKSGAYILGPALKDLEAEFAAYIGTKYALGVGSGTDALTFGLKAVGIKKGDEVIVPSFTFTATALAVIHAGDFFGEIGLLQNSAANAQVAARQDMRCLGISRVEFLRFVTHNHTVALELERVSSKRLGRPIFPLKKGNFRST